MLVNLLQSQYIKKLFLNSLARLHAIISPQSSFLSCIVLLVHYIFELRGYIKSRIIIYKHQQANMTIKCLAFFCLLQIEQFFRCAALQFSNLAPPSHSGTSFRDNRQWRNWKFFETLSREKLIHQNFQIGSVFNFLSCHFHFTVVDTLDEPPPPTTGDINREEKIVFVTGKLLST